MKRIKTKSIFGALCLFFVISLFSVFCSISFNTISVSAYSASISTSNSVTLDATINGTGTSIKAESINIQTDCRAGYNLNIATPNGSNLYLNGNNSENASFTAVDGTSALSSSNNTNKWGYTLATNPTSSTVFLPLSANTSVLKTPAQTASPNSNINDTFDINYGVHTDETITPGAYRMGNNGTIVYYLTMDETCMTVNIAYDGNNADAGTMGAAGTGVIHTGVKDGDTIDLIASNFSRTGYGFAGWSTDQNAGAKLIDNDNTNNPIVYGPQETVTLPNGFTNYDTDNDGIVKLYAVWIPSQGNLQGWVGCTNLDTATYDSTTGALDLTKNSVTALTDQRDNDTYAVARLADGQCWMIENLRLEADNTRTAEKQALAQGYGTSATYGNFSGLADAESANFTGSTTANSLYYSGTQEGTASIDIGTSNYPAYRMPRYNNWNNQSASANRPQNPTTNDATNSTTNAGMYSYGNYYTWHAAIADLTYNGTNNQSTTGTSLCPTGWHLPKGGNKSNESNNEFWSLVVGGINGNTKPANYDSSTSPNYTGTPEGTDASNKLRTYPNNFLYSGFINRSWAYFRGSSGSCWSSTAYTNSSSFYLYLNSSNVSPGTDYNDKGNGRSIRCVAPSNLYAVHYDANTTDTVTGTMTNQSITEGVSTNLRTNAFIAPVGYKFKEWNTKQDGTGTSFSDGQSVTNLTTVGNTITLYAIWVKGALLDTGRTVNSKLKSLAATVVNGVDTTITPTFDPDNEDWEHAFDEYIKSINVHLETPAPAGFTPTEKNTISSSASVKPIYIVFDNTNDAGVMHFYTEGEQIILSADSSFMFYMIPVLAEISGIASWDASNAVDMSYMFYYTGASASTFAINLSSWDVSSATDMSNMFSTSGYNSTNWSVGDLSSWNTSNVINMSQMFQSAGYSATTWSVGNLSSWDTSNVTDMSYIFDSAGYRATTFVLNLSAWNTSNVTDMSSMFSGTGNSATTWSVGDLSSWDTSSVTDMSVMFSDTGNSATTWFVGDLSSWDTSSVTDMSSMFYWAGCNATTWSVGDLSSWDTSNVINMSSMFSWAGSSAATFTLDLSSWDTSSVTNMRKLFSEAGYNATTWSVGDLSSWNTSNVTDMSSMFGSAGYRATTFNLDLSSWNTSSVTNMSYMFYSVGYNATTWSVGDLSSWNTSNVINMSQMFQSAGYSATTWSVGNLSSWDTSNVTDMSYIFDSAGYSSTTFVLNLSAWNTSSVTNMRELFSEAGYNATTWSVGNLSSWNTASVTNMYQMFNYAGYNATIWSVGNLSAWNTASVTNMYYMFFRAGYSSTTFSLDLSSWNTASVTTMYYMFYDAGYNATTFTLNLSSWDTSNVKAMTSMFTGAGRRATTWSVTIPRTNNGTTSGSISNTTSRLYGDTTSVYATPRTGKTFTLAN